jgi:hypothetical protein
MMKLFSLSGPGIACRRLGGECGCDACGSRDAAEMLAELDRLR